MSLYVGIVNVFNDGLDAYKARASKTNAIPIRIISLNGMFIDIIVTLVSIPTFQGVEVLKYFGCT